MFLGALDVGKDVSEKEGDSPERVGVLLSAFSEASETKVVGDG